MVTKVAIRQKMKRREEKKNVKYGSLRVCCRNMKYVFGVALFFVLFLLLFNSHSLALTVRVRLLARMSVPWLLLFLLFKLSANM